MAHAHMDLRTAGGPERRSGVAAELSRILAALGRVVALWANRRAVYRLAALDDRQLSDIGVSRADVFWALSHPWRVDPSLALAKRVECRRAAQRWARRHR